MNKLTIFGTPTMGSGRNKTPLIFLHGFLGSPMDWEPTLHSLFRITSETQPLKSSKEEHGPELLPFYRGFIFNTHPLFSCLLPDFMNEPRMGPSIPLKDWGKRFCELNRPFLYPRIETTDSTNRRKPYLIGYSLGARLALHAYSSAPQTWEGLICISGNPGFPHNTPQHDIRKRIEDDLAWAQQFEFGDWQKVMKLWNQQGVFAQTNENINRIHWHRNEPSQEMRETLGRCLDSWSLGRQENFRPILRDYAERILWLVGAQDSKFCRIGQDIKEENPKLNLKIIPDSSHRIPLDNPEELARSLFQFIQRSD